ncbi:RluA family pseudouridine synthase [Bacillaceae bacterium Marseille-Q3522]|nr:RluA family pseudouridine synthase [Bacillaceae bacterium Marseille-Q3522]
MVKIWKEVEWCLLEVPSEWAGLSVAELLQNEWKAGKKQIHSIRMAKAALVNKKPANWQKPLQINDQLAIKMFTALPFDVVPAPQNIKVLYEDDHLIVLNKPAFIDTHPNHKDENNALINTLAYYLQGKNEYRKIMHIHRLDRDTSGAILFAKHPLIGSILDRMLSERQIKRTYFAAVHGIIEKRNGTIAKPIGRDRHHSTRRRVSKTGQDAVTHYEVISFDAIKQLTIIKCQLDTGRTHQIRVHFSSIGHPLAGDLLYGGKPVFNRQALHAASLTFVHPFTKEKINCVAQETDEVSAYLNVAIQRGNSSY